jgi:hypothetical protein
MPRNPIDENDLDLRSTDFPCDRCGQGIPATTIEKRKSRKYDNWDLCADCVRVPAKCIKYKHPVLGDIFCYPHLGDVDELWRPLDESGGLYRAGVRLCGHADCVNRNHIQGLKIHKKYADDLESLLAQIEAQDYNRKNAIVSDTIKSGASPKVN